VSAQRTGDWAKVRHMLAGAPARVRAAAATALRQEAHLLRKEIVEGLTSQAPGGEPLKPLSPLTIATRQLKGRKGTKALIERGDLRNAIAVVMDGDAAFVGVPRKARTADGKSLADVAQAQEFGLAPRMVPVTPAMRRFLFAMLRKAGIPSTGTGTGKGVIVVEVPARPFLRPAFEKFSRGAQRRFLGRMAGLLGLSEKSE
jgi:phage gpG-like protein